MKYKKLMLVTFVLLAILTLGAVNAADVSDSDGLAVDDVGGSDSVASPVNDDDLLSDDDDGGNDEGNGTDSNDDVTIPDDLGNGTDSNDDVTIPDDLGNGTDSNDDVTIPDDEGGNDEEDSFEVWVDNDPQGFDVSAPDLSGYFIGSVTVPENMNGNISIITENDEFLFNKALNDFGSNYIRENIYDITLSDNGRYIFEGVEDGTLFRFAFLDDGGNELWGSSYYRLTIDENIIRFEEIDGESHGPDAWINYESNGKIYTDTKEEVVCVSVPYGFEGTVFVEVNGEEKGSWEIESYDEEYDSYHDWKLGDLEISEEGNYTIVVKLNDKIIKSENITVCEFNNDEFRFVFDFEGKMAKLYCPEGIEGTLTVTTVKYFDEDCDEVYWDSFNLANVTGWSEWNLMDLGLDYDDVWTEFTFYIANNEDELFTVNKKVRCSYDDAEYHINIWDENDERGTLYTDSEGNVVGIDVSRSFDGNIIIYVNNDEKVNWEIEFDDEDDRAYRDWGLEDLGISDAGNYTIEIVRNNGNETETLLSKEIAVYSFNNETFRAMILYASECIKLYVPDGAQGNVTIITEKENDEGELGIINEETYEITANDSGIWKEWSLAELGFEADGAFRVFTLTITDNNDDEVYRYRISHVDGEREDDGDEDEYLEDIMFRFNTLNEDGDMEFDKALNVDVGHVYIPQMVEFEDIDVTLYITLNGQEYATLNVRDLYGFYSSSRHALGFEVPLNLTEFKDKDILTLRLEAEFKNGESAIIEDEEFDVLILEDKGDYFIGHDDYNPERLEFSVFFGNLTTNHTNDPELMGANFHDNFVIITISNALDITEGTITVVDEDSNVVFSKALSDCDKEYDYGSVGYQYVIRLSEVKDKLPEGTNLTIAFNYGNTSLTQKRIRFADYIYKFVNLEDIEEQFHFEINEDLLLHESDTAIHLSTDSNRQFIYIGLGGGYFIIYVDGVKVENLGDVSFNTWKNDGGWIYNDDAYDENDYPIEEGDEYPNETAFLNYVRSYWGSELELFRLASWRQGAPELDITLADLGINKSGTYNIRIVHFPSIPGGLDDHWNPWGGSQYAEEMLVPTYTEVLNANITCNLDPDYAGVEILKERIYKNGQPFLFTFQFGDNVLSESNRILVYINDELAFNGTTLFYEENDEGEMKLVDLWELNDGQLNEGLLNEYGVLDVGEYEAVVYLVKGDAAPVEISRGNFTVITQRGDMNFTMGSSVEDDGVHTILYADIPEGKWDGYSLEIYIDDSESILPSEDEVDDWFPRWYDEYVIFKDDKIALKESLDDIIGKGPVAIDLGVLANGTHIWVVFYHGEETIFGDWDFYQNDFTVKDGDVTSAIELDDIEFTYGESGSAKVTLVGAKDIIASVVGHDEANVTFADGKLTVSGLDAGNYTLKITTVPEEGYSATTKLVNITVNKADIPLTVEVNVTTVGQKATVYISVRAPSGALVKLKRDGNTYEAISVFGAAYYEFYYQNAGPQTVTVRFEGDNNYNPAENNATFNIDKFDSPISIDIPKVEYTAFDNFQITIGNVTAVNVTINNKAYAVKSDGTVDIDTTALDADTYTVVASNEENDVYKANSTSKSFTIVKKASEVSIDVGQSYNVGDNFTIGIDNNTAATVTINNAPYEIKDGKVVVDTTKLAAGEYTVVATIAGNGKYIASSDTASFKINKITPSIVITAGEAIEGSDLTVEVSIAGATGVVNINGENITLTDAKATTTFTDLIAGNMVVNVVYYGDVNYLNASNSLTVPVKAKQNAGLKLFANDIYVGETVTITIVFNVNVTGKVTIEGNEVDIANGKGIYSISGLTAGEHTVTAIFAGDKYFNAETANVTFKVAKVEIPANSTTIPVDGNAKESKTPTYSINLPSDATGTLTVTINGKNYTANVVNGKADVKVSDLKPGNYKATITYSGDDKYSPIVKTTTSTVVVDPKVVATQTSVLYTGKYSVTVYGKDGKVAKSQAVKFYINGKYVKTVKTNSKGVATFNIHNKYLPNKKYTVKAVALGKTASKKVTVKQILTLKTVKVKKSGKLVLTANVKKVNGYFPKGKITFRFRGNVVKTVALKNGVAKVTVPSSKYNRLAIGSTVKYSATYLKTTVQKKTKVIK